MIIRGYSIYQLKGSSFQHNKGTKHMSNKSISECYPDGVCPDCGEEIPDDCTEGQECNNCGHVFYFEHDDDDKTNC